MIFEKVHILLCQKITCDRYLNQEQINTWVF